MGEIHRDQQATVAPKEPVILTPEKDQWDGNFEFGGTAGVIGLLVFSHVITYYLWLCIEFFGGDLAIPSLQLWSLLLKHASPTWFTFLSFTGFLLFELFLAAVLPGPVTYGLPLPSENGRKIPYRCNAITAWYIILITFAALHISGVFPLWTLRQNFGRYMTCAVIYGDAVAVLVYLYGFAAGRTLRMSGNHLYDFFMGSCLNPRLPGMIDLKMFAELRNSWVILFLLSASAAAEMWRVRGYLTPNMCFILFAHLLYVNACQKGEECIPTTWDIYYEKFGWMLIFWNFEGVPFLYCFQSLYIQTITPTFYYPPLVTVAMFFILLGAYYIFDTANSQKNRFRMKRQGVPEHIIKRKTFPQLPWGYIQNPRTIKGDDGKELFVDGWYRYGRKIHYTADMTMSFLWGFSCGRFAVIPFFYFIFFFSILVHRALRDEAKCRLKYRKLWVEYTALVPHRFIPGVF